MPEDGRLGRACNPFVEAGVQRRVHTYRCLSALPIPENVVHRLVHCLFVLTLLPHAIAAQQSPHQPTPLTAAEVVRWRADLRFLAAEMPKRHRNLFHRLTREEFDRAVRRLDARIPTLRRHQIILELARLAARVGDGHTNVAPARDSAIGFHALPIQLYLFADGLYVRAADSAHAGLVRARVVRLGRVTMEEAVAAVRPLIGRDNEMGARYAAPFLLVMPEVLHGLGLIDDLDRVPLLLERDGRREEVVLAPAGLAPLVARDTDRSWEPRPGWIDARGAPDGWPLWLRQPGNKFWFAYLAPARALYVQFNEVGDKPDQTVARSATACSPSLERTRSTGWSSTCVSTAAGTAGSTGRWCSGSSAPTRCATGGTSSCSSAVAPSPRRSSSRATSSGGPRRSSSASRPRRAAITTATRTGSGFPTAASPCASPPSTGSSQTPGISVPGRRRTSRPS
jgi:hypothetical protein